MPYKDPEKNKACKSRFNKSEVGKEYKRQYYAKHSSRYRDSIFRRRYGITIDQYNELADKQNGVCAICQETCKSGRRLAVDHCHATGKIRGLLCMDCNRSIGGLKDSIELLEKAVSYLKHNSILTDGEAHGG